MVVSVLQEQRAAAGKAHRRARRAELQVVIDNVPALIGKLDADRRYRFVNRQYRSGSGVRLRSS